MTYPFNPLYIEIVFIGHETYTINRIRDKRLSRNDESYKVV